MNNNIAQTAPVFPVYFANQDESRAIKFENESTATIVRVDSNLGGTFMSLQRRYVLPSFFLSCKVSMLEITKPLFYAIATRALDAQEQILQPQIKQDNGQN